MSKAIFKVSALAVLIVVFCGWGALGAVVDGIWQMIVAFSLGSGKVSNMRLRNTLHRPISSQARS